MNMKEFIKKEPVLSISFLAALISCFFVHPDKTYLSYIDCRTLSLLLCLMLVVEGLNRSGIFKALAAFICRKSSNLRILVISLVMLTFVCSMMITNDVALITFVPFSILVLSMAGKKEHLIWTVVVQTVAANMGSMLTPVGNPQNLYLFSCYNLGFGEFFSITTPVWIFSLAACLLLCLRIQAEPLSLQIADAEKINKKSAAVYALLFLICLLVVFRLIAWYWMLGIVLVIILIYDKNVIKSADITLLLTFICFFVFSGNLARIDTVKDLISRIMAGREFLTAALCSQCISNVPAALLLSAFTDNAKALILGTDIGGLGTPIASMASLISYKLYCSDKNAEPGHYMARFLIVNFILLILFCAAALLFLL